MDLKQRPKWLGPAIVGGAIVLIIIISVIAKHGPAPVAVTTIAVKPGTLVNKLPENGTLSLPQTATIAAQTASTIERILVREGGRVRAGDLLMKLDDRAASAKVSADDAAVAQALATLRKAQQTAAVSGDSNVQSVAQAQENLLSAQSQLQSDINAKREGQVSAAGFASLGLSGQSQLAQQVSQLKDTETNLRTAKEQYDGDVALYKMDAIAHLQLNRDQAAYEQAQAAYDSALRQYTLTKQQLNDSVGQQDAKIAADRHAVDSSRAALSAAQIQAGQNTAAVDVASAQAGEASASAQLQYDEEQLAYTEVRAPFNGVVQTLGNVTSPLGGTADLSVGDQVTPGQTLFTIAGSGPMVVKAQVDEQDVISVKLGQHAFITGEDFPGYSLVGTVVRIAPVVIAQNQAGNSAKNVETTIALGKTYPFLRDGMSCDVDIVTGKAANALVVPLSAIVDDGAKHYAFVIGSGTAKKTQVTEGIKNDTDVAIAKGLKSGDVVATTNISSLKDGSKVSATAASPAPTGSSGP